MSDQLPDVIYVGESAFSKLLIAKRNPDNIQEHDTKYIRADVVEKMKAAMQEFVDRVEAGEVRSVYTHAKFKQILAQVSDVK